jgi:hypothetical protein
MWRAALVTEKIIRSASGRVLTCIKYAPKKRGPAQRPAQAVTKREDLRGGPCNTHTHDATPSIAL